MDLLCYMALVVVPLLVPTTLAMERDTFDVVAGITWEVQGKSTPSDIRISRLTDLNCDPNQVESLRSPMVSVPDRAEQNFVAGAAHARSVGLANDTMLVAQKGGQMEATSDEARLEIVCVVPFAENGPPGLHD